MSVETGRRRERAPPARGGRAWGENLGKMIRLSPSNTGGVSARGGWSGGGQTFADGVASELGDVVEVELVHDVLAVGVDRLGADEQDGGDFLGAFALGDELDDFAFLGGQGRGGSGFVGGELADDDVGDVG